MVECLCHRHSAVHIWFYHPVSQADSFKPFISHLTIHASPHASWVSSCDRSSLPCSIICMSISDDSLVGITLSHTFTLFLHAVIPHLAICVKVTDVERGDSLAVTPVRLQRWYQSRKRGKTEAQIRSVQADEFTDWEPNRSFTRQKRNVPHFNPQSSITGPDNRNVVTGSVFDDLYNKKNTAVIRGKVSVILSVLPTFITFLLEKWCLAQIAEPGSSCSWMAMIMWWDLEPKHLTHHVTFCYCVVVGNVSCIEKNHYIMHWHVSFGSAAWFSVNEQRWRKGEPSLRR